MSNVVSADTTNIKDSASRLKTHDTYSTLDDALKISKGQSANIIKNIDYIIDESVLLNYAIMANISDFMTTFAEDLDKIDQLARENYTY